jgi:hypothetical protein
MNNWIHKAAISAFALVTIAGATAADSAISLSKMGSFHIGGRLVEIRRQADPTDVVHSGTGHCGSERALPS